MNDPHPPAARSATDPRATRRDPLVDDRWSVWRALSQTPGVGVSVMDARGGLLFVNPASQQLFFDRVGADYRGKTVHDFHPPGFCAERIELIGRVLRERKPIRIRHVYFGRRIESTVWPIDDRTPPFDRVIVVSHNLVSGPLAAEVTGGFETYETHYIDLGPLDVLSKRELEVFVLLGHGLSVPETAATLHRSPNTIQRHKEAIGRKLRLHGQAEIVRMVASIGLELGDVGLTRYGDDRPAP